MWSQTACRKPMTICLSTVEKFKQRVPLEYRPRVPSFPYHIQHYKSSNIYHYYDFSIKRRNEFEHLQKYIKDGNHLRLLNRMNSHDRFAAVLGILLRKGRYSGSILQWDARHRFSTCSLRPLLISEVRVSNQLGQFSMKIYLPLSIGLLCP